MKALLVGINAKYIHSNLAIRYLKEFSDSKSDFNIELAEFTINQPLALIMSEIIKRQPNAIGLSCYIWNYDYIKRLVVELKKLMPSCFIFLGGPEVSYNPSEVIAETNCDSVICGEGEQAFFSILQDLSTANPIAPIITGTIVPLDEIPFVYHDYAELENKIVYYEASRGCPFKCGYCLSGGSNVRFLSLERVFCDLKKFLDAELLQVKFIDRTFNCNKKYAMAIWHFLAENDNGITNFHFEIAAELLDNECIEFLQSVRRGQFQLEIGIQSTNPPTLTAIKRNTDTIALTKTITALEQNENIHLHLDLIAGLPFEGYEQFSCSFNYVHSLSPDQLQLGFLKLLKGSALYGEQEKYGLIATDYPPYEVMKTNWLSYYEVQQLKLVEEMVELYYNSSRYKKSLAYLCPLFDTPFSFFQQLGNYYEQSGYHLRPHSKVEYYEILWEFIEQCKSSAIDKQRFFSAVIYDIYSHEKAKKLPSFIKVNLSDENRNRIFSFFDNKDNVAKYIPEYQEFDTKQLIRNAHIEIFPPHTINTSDTEIALLFNYRCCDLLGNAKVIQVEV